MPSAGWFWDWTAKSFDERSRRAEEDAHYSDLVERVSAHLGPEDAVLDFGCATGAVALKVADRVGSVLGIDASRRMIELARERAREQGSGTVSFAHCTLFDSELEPASFDVVLAFNVLHLVEDPAAAARRMHALLRPGGRAITVTPSTGEAGAVARTALRLTTRVGLLRHLHAFRLDDMSTLLREAGFAIVDSDVLPDEGPASFVVARKASQA